MPTGVHRARTAAAADSSRVLFAPRRGCGHCDSDARAPTTARMGPRLALLARTAEDLCKPTGPLSLARVEVRRDRAIALGASLQAVLTCALEDIGSVLVEDASPDPESFFERVTERLRRIDEQSRRLGSERHQRRGEREQVRQQPTAPAL